jgi:hypothetical protein
MAAVPVHILSRSSSPLQSFSFGVLNEVDNIWDDGMTQILQHIPSIQSLCLVYSWCEVGGSSFLQQLSPRILDNGQVDCLIPKLDTISIWLSCQLDTPDYGALKEMIVSRCTLAHNTGDNISGPIERIQKVTVECTYDESLDCTDDTMWYEEVSEILTPLQEVVDMVKIVIYV